MAGGFFTVSAGPSVTLVFGFSGRRVSRDGLEISASGLLCPQKSYAKRKKVCGCA